MGRYEAVNRVVKFNINSTMNIVSVTDISGGDAFTYQPDTIFILGPEGYTADSTIVYDDEEHEYTVKYPYIPKKQ